MAADEGDMEAADEVADHQEEVAPLAERLAQRLARGLTAAARLARGGDLLAVVQSDRQQDHDHGERRQRPHGGPPVAEPVLQHRGQRHDEELAERAAGRTDADGKGGLGGRRHAQDHAQYRPERGGRQADADQDIAQDQHGAVMHEGRHDHAQHIDHGAAGDGEGRAEAVAQPAGEGREGAHQQHRDGGAEGEQLAADMQLGRDRLEEDAKALAYAQANGQDEETAPHGGPIGARGHARI